MEGALRFIDIKTDSRIYYLYWGNGYLEIMESMKTYLYTNRDKGMTGIYGGERVLKMISRIEANGCIDELNAVIGIVRSFLPGARMAILLFSIQKHDGSDEPCGYTINYP